MLRITVGLVIGVVLAVAAFAVAAPSSEKTLESRVASLETEVLRLRKTIKLSHDHELEEHQHDHDHEQPFQTIMLDGEGNDGYHIHVESPLPAGKYRMTYTSEDSQTAGVTTTDGFGNGTGITLYPNTPKEATAIEGHLFTHTVHPADSLGADDELYIQVQSRTPWTLTIEAVTAPQPSQPD